MKLLDLIRFGLPPVFTACATAMVISNQLSLSVNQIASLTNLHRSEVDHFGQILRAKRIGTYRTGIITITDQRYLDLAQSLAKPPKTAPEPCQVCLARDEAEAAKTSQNPDKAATGPIIEVIKPKKAKAGAV